MGTQCWVFLIIMVTEAIICLKFGKEIFEQTKALTIALWLLIQFVLSCLCLYGCVLYHRHFGKKGDSSAAASKKVDKKSKGSVKVKSKTSKTKNSAN